MRLSDFDIDFIKFKNESESFKFKLDDTFFKLKEGSLYSSCDIVVDLNCSKNDSTINLDYTLQGVVNTNCDRCLDDIAIEINANFSNVLKLTAKDDLLAEENYLSINHQIYSVYDSLYEQTCLNMPAKRTCENSLKNVECELNYQTEEVEKPVDERWNELKKLLK